MKYCFGGEKKKKQDNSTFPIQRNNQMVSPLLILLCLLTLLFLEYVFIIFSGVLRISLFPLIIPAGFTYASESDFRVCPCMAILFSRGQYEEHFFSEHVWYCRLMISRGWDPLSLLDFGEWVAARCIGKPWMPGYWYYYLIVRWRDPCFPFAHPANFSFNGY